MTPLKKLKFLIIFALIIGLIAVLFLGQNLVNQIKNLPEIKTYLIKRDPSTVKIKDIEIIVDIARTDKEKAKGLAARTKLGKNEGMLFVFENKTQPNFWMKDMNFPIDIIWIADEKIIGIETNVPTPEKNTPAPQLPLYKPPVGIDYVLEVNAGFSDQHSIKVDDTVEIILSN